MTEQIRNRIQSNVLRWHKEKSQIINKAKEANLLQKAGLVEQAVDLQHQIEAGVLALIGVGENGSNK